MNTIAAGIATRTSLGVWLQTIKAPSRFPMKNVMSSESVINPMVQGSARAIRDETSVGNVAVESPKSNRAMFLRYLTY